MTPRQYLDRRRLIPLDGRPFHPDWTNLLHLGMRATQTQPQAPFLQDVMWTGIAQRARFARPVLFDHQLLRRWLAAEPVRCMDYLRQQWDNLRAPDHADEALAILARPDCYTALLGGHRLTVEQAMHEHGPHMWVAGTCNDCRRALLWHFDEYGNERTWPFYDSEADAADDHIRPGSTEPARDNAAPGDV